MGVRLDPRRRYRKPWVATVRHRELHKDLYLGMFATKEEAQAVVEAWYTRKYGGRANSGNRKAG